MTEVSDLAAAERSRHTKAVVSASRRSRRADATAEECREDFYRTLVDAHGDPTLGKMTYDEIATATGWSKGWVRLAISNWRKRQERASE